LEKRIEELNSQKIALHSKIVQYNSIESDSQESEMLAIAEEYRMLRERKVVID
jgi:hypothetical protein